MYGAIWDKCRICLDLREEKTPNHVVLARVYHKACLDLRQHGPLWFRFIIIRDDCVEEGVKDNEVPGRLYTCTRTRDIWLDLTDDYETIRRLMVANGDIGLIYPILVPSLREVLWFL
jgi:hypothetical protein